MTPTLVQGHHPTLSARSTSRPAAPLARARDWAEIQERMLSPLYEAVYARLEVGEGTRLLGLNCGSGLALLMASAVGADVCGLDTDEHRLALARERLAPREERAEHPVRLVSGGTEHLAGAGADEPRFTLVTVFEPPLTVGAGGPRVGGKSLTSTLATAVPFAERGAAVVLTGWGPPERCATSPVLRVAARLADPMCAPARWQPCGRDDLETIAQRAGLRPDGSGRVACPFGYADMDSAVRGLLSTGLFDAAERATDRALVRKEIAEAIHPYQRQDGTVWMPNVLRYLVARV